MEGDVLRGFTKRYWSHKELAEGLHLSRGHLYRLLEEGHMLGPDVVVAADNLGWDPRRARRFGVDTDRLDADGNPIGPPADGALAKAATLIKTRYSVKPKVYLSSWLASYAYGLKASSVYFIRKRSTGFIPADVVVDGKYGWSEERVIEFGEQTGRMDDTKINKWMIRRTEEFGLDPDIPWVQRRLNGTAAHLRDRVDQAVAVWRERQKNDQQG